MAEEPCADREIAAGEGAEPRELFPPSDNGVGCARLRLLPVHCVELSCFSQHHQRSSGESYSITLLLLMLHWCPLCFPPISVPILQFEFVENNCTTRLKCFDHNCAIRHRSVLTECVTHPLPHYPFPFAASDAFHSVCGPHSIGPWSECAPPLSGENRATPALRVASCSAFPATRHARMREIKRNRLFERAVWCGGRGRLPSL